MDIRIVNIGQLISAFRINPSTRRADLRVLEQDELFIRDSRIVMPSPKHASTHVEQVDARGAVVMPGLIDAHRYAVSDVAGDAQVPPVAGEDARILAANGRILDRAMKSGTTTLELKCRHGVQLHSLLSVTEQLRRRGRPRVVSTLQADLDQCPEDRDAMISSLISQSIPTIRQRKQADFCEIRCAKGGEALAHARMVLRAARAAGMRLKLLLEEDPPDGVLDLARELNASSLAQAEYIKPEEWSAHPLLECIPVFVPGARQRSDHGAASVESVLKDGKLVGLATGGGDRDSGPASLWAVMALAISELGMTLEDALVACTAGNAAALEMDETLGTVSAGMVADLAILDIGDYRELRYGLGDNPVRQVLVGGQPVELR